MDPDDAAIAQILAQGPNGPPATSLAPDDAAVEQILRQGGHVQPVAAPQSQPTSAPAQGNGNGSLWGDIQKYGSGISQGLYSIPQSVAEIGARGIDLIPGTSGHAYQNLHSAFQDMNAIAQPDQNNKYVKGGNIVGQILSTAPVAAAMSPFEGPGFGAALGNGLVQGGTTAALTSNNSSAPLWQQVGLGAGVGGVAGGGAHLIGKAAGWGVNKLASTLTGNTPDPAATTLLQYIKPEDAADLADAGNKPMTLMDTGDNSQASRLGRMLVTMPGQQSKDITDFLQGRAASQADRLTDDVATHLANGQDLNGLQAGIMAGQKANAAPLYQQAFATNTNVSSPEIDRILATPAGNSALKTASTMMQNDRSLMGISDPDLLEQAAEGGTDIPWKGGVASGLKLRSLDYIKQALDDEVQGAYSSGNNAQGRILSGLTSDFRDALDAADVTAKAGPNSTKAAGGLYAQARAAWSGPARSLDAMTAGQSFLKPGTNIASDMSGLSDSESQLYKVGAAKAIQDKIASVGDNRDATTAIFGNPAIRQKIATVFGPDAVDKFANVAVAPEQAMQQTKNFVLGGSQTANKVGDLAAPKGWVSRLGDVLSGGAGGFLVGGPHGAAGGALGPIVSGVKDATSAAITNLFPSMDEETATKLGSLLTQTGPQGLASFKELTDPALSAARRSAVARALLQSVAPAAGAGAYMTVRPNVLQQNQQSQNSGSRGY